MIAHLFRCRCIIGTLKNDTCIITNGCLAAVAQERTGYHAIAACRINNAHQIQAELVYALHAGKKSRVVHNVHWRNEDQLQNLQCLRVPALAAVQ